MRKSILGIAAALLILANTPAHAKVLLDVTATGSTATGLDRNGNSFLVANTAIQPTGTGVISPFLTIQQTGQERGYNTDGTEPLDTKRSGGGFTRAIQLGQLSTTVINGVQYLQFLLDVNQTANGPISLNQLQFFTSPTDLSAGSTSLTEATNETSPGVGGNDAIIDFSTKGGTEVFRMNNLQNNGTNLAMNQEILVDTGNGSGSGDAFFYVRSSLFGTNLNSYVTLFAQFGHPNGSYESNSGFEEFSYRAGNGPTFQATPEPSTLVMASMAGLMGLGAIWRKRRSRRDA